MIKAGNNFIDYWSHCLHQLIRSEPLFNKRLKGNNKRSLGQWLPQCVRLPFIRQDTFAQDMTHDVAEVNNVFFLSPTADFVDLMQRTVAQKVQVSNLEGLTDGYSGFKFAQIIGFSKLYCLLHMAETAFHGCQTARVIWLCACTATSRGWNVCAPCFY